MSVTLARCSLQMCCKIYRSYIVSSVTYLPLAQTAGLIKPPEEQPAAGLPTTSAACHLVMVFSMLAYYGWGLCIQHMYASHTGLQGFTASPPM